MNKTRLLAVPALLAFYSQPIHAHEAEKMAGMKASQSKGKGTISAGGMDLDFTFETLSQLPDKHKIVVELTVNGMNITVNQVFNGGDWQVRLARIGTC